MEVPFNPYTILSIASDASNEEIKQAYRRIAMRLHPDKNLSKGAVIQFQDINLAYEILIDPERRGAYDRERRARENLQQEEFMLRVTPSKRYVYPFEEPQVIYLLAEVYAEQSTTDQAESRQRDARLNLTLVLDRSNSMNGTRLDRVKAAANQIIEQLTANDFLSIVTFNDFAEVVIEAGPVENKALLKARVSMIAASGGTEIFKGLSLGVEQNRSKRNNSFVNHVIMLTDGNTYGDQDRCLSLAEDLTDEGIGVSALGIGQEWNDEFLDKLASITGGVAEYVMNANSVQHFLNDHVRSLANTFAERLQTSIATDADISMESAFKLSPRPQPLSIESPAIQIGNLQYHRMTSVLFQLELPPHMKEGFRSIARIAVQGDILINQVHRHTSISDISLGVTTEQHTEEPPANVLDALGKLTLYRMQERAKDALERGDTQEATRRLENLATRLFEHGEEELAQQALAEARQVAYTSTLSDKGSKALKYQTRSLLLNSREADL